MNWESLFELLFPTRPVCHLCGSPGLAEPHICLSCLTQIRNWQDSQAFCRHCGRWMPYRGVCEECREAPPLFRIARALGPYQDPLKRAVLALKYQRRQRLARTLGRLIGEQMLREDLIKGLPVVIPVPMSYRRRKERGYNQAELLARALANCLKLPMANCLKKTRETPAQAGLDRQERLQNLFGAFTVTVGGMIRGKEVLLVDDVLTTGATAGECARVLLSAGAAGVSVAAVAASFTRPLD
ncbi:MAG: ComF family protein [Bacillota bacterium]